MLDKASPARSPGASAPYPSALRLVHFMLHCEILFRPAGNDDAGDDEGGWNGQGGTDDCEQELRFLVAARLALVQACRPGLRRATRRQPGSVHPRRAASVVALVPRA